MKTSLFFSLLAALAVCSVAVAASDKRELVCVFEGNAQADAPYYGDTIKLILEGDRASLSFEGADDGDTGRLSKGANRYYRLRYWGFRNHASCARGNYMDADRDVAKGNPGRIEFSGPGGDDCHVAHDFYDCR